jgi:hypothetical protein
MEDGKRSGKKMTGRGMWNHAGVGALFYSNGRDGAHYSLASEDERNGGGGLIRGDF